MSSVETIPAVVSQNYVPLRNVSAIPDSEVAEAWNKAEGRGEIVAKMLGCERYGLTQHIAALRKKGIPLVKGKKGRRAGSGSGNTAKAAKARKERSQNTADLLSFLGESLEFGGTITAQIGETTVTVQKTETENTATAAETKQTAKPKKNGGKGKGEKVAN